MEKKGECRDKKGELKEKYVFDKENKIIAAWDLEPETAKSGKYTCIFCKNKMLFIGPYTRKGGVLIRQFFKHKGETCLNNDTPATRKQYRENKLSDFHRVWQNLFPIENKEIRTIIDGKYLIGDIVIDSTELFNLKNEDDRDILDKSCKTLTIEIQHSPIDNDKLLDRDATYRSDDKNLMWIFDTKDKMTVEKIVLFNGYFYRIKLKGKHYFTEMLGWNRKVNILLDNGSKWIYQVTGTTILDVEYVRANRILRKNLLKQFANILAPSKLGTWEGNDDETLCAVYDYEEEEINEQISYIFYLMEKIPRKYFNVIYLCNMLSKISNKSEFVCRCLIRWVKKFDYSEDRYYYDDPLIDQYSRIYPLDKSRSKAKIDYSEKYIKRLFMDSHMVDDCFDMMVYLVDKYQDVNPRITSKMANDETVSYDDNLRMKCDFIRKRNELLGIISLVNFGDIFCILCGNSGHICIGKYYYRICSDCYYDIDSVKFYEKHVDCLKTLNDVNLKKFVSHLKRKFCQEWKQMFPSHCIDTYMDHNNEIVLADIFTKNTGKDQNGTIVTMQNTELYSHQKLINLSQERHQDLIWLLELNYGHSKEKIILFDGDHYQIKFESEQHFRGNVIFDDGGEYLYQTIVDINMKSKTIFSVAQIKRNDLLKTLNCKIHWKSMLEDHKYITYDYEVSNDDKVRYIFYVIETLPFPFFGVAYICALLAKLSNECEKVKALLKLWVVKNVANRMYCIRTNVDCARCDYQYAITTNFLKHHNDHISYIKCQNCLPNQYTDKSIDRIFKTNDDHDDFNVFMHIISKYKGMYPLDFKLKIPIEYQKSKYSYENIDMEIEFAQKCKNFVNCVICGNGTLIKICRVTYGICAKCFNRDKINEYYKQKFECNKCRQMLCVRTHDNIGQTNVMCEKCGNAVKMLSIRNSRQILDDSSDSEDAITNYPKSRPQHRHGKLPQPNFRNTYSNKYDSEYRNERINGYVQQTFFVRDRYGIIRETNTNPGTQIFR